MADPVDVVFVLVHYRTPNRLARAVEEAQQELRRSNLRFEIVVVDNSGDVDGGVLSETCRVLLPKTNLGYAAAANLAFRSARARYLVLSNPDVAMQPGCLRELIRACPTGGVVGPSFYWDDEQRLKLPPTELQGTTLVTRVLARWSTKRAQDSRRRAWRRHARRHWRATAEHPSYYLSGALLMFDAQAIEQVGPLDENFRLYFEETDWLRRAKELGVEALLVPRAVATHSFNQSAQHEPASARWYAESEQLFHKRYRLRTISALEELQAGQASPQRWPGGIEVSSETKELWFEISATKERFPAACERLDGEQIARATGGDGSVLWRPPASVAARVRGWWLTITDEAGRELECYEL